MCMFSDLKRTTILLKLCLSLINKYNGYLSMIKIKCFTVESLRGHPNTECIGIRSSHKYQCLIYFIYMRTFSPFEYLIQ